ncbi:MAG: CHAD domain-containing protein [Magnetococcales bacterium]|nr:CHAD domain-containing protein [Magnetococcales bacterium]
MAQAPVQPGQSIDDAFQSILRADWKYTKSWLPVAYHRESIEGLHQGRIGLRRMRSALSIFRRKIPRRVLIQQGMEMKWLADAFSPARDVDVFVEETLNDETISGKVHPLAGEEKLHVITKKRSDIGYELVRETLDSDRFKVFKEAFPLWIENKGWREQMKPEKLGRLDKPIEPYAAEVMNRRFNRILAAGPELYVMDDEELHQVRIRIKKVRYASEFFGDIFDKEKMAKFSALTKAVQSQMGTINDVAVMGGVIARLLEGEGDSDVISYIIGVTALRGGQKHVAKEGLAERWKQLSSLELPWVDSPDRIGDEWD